MTKDHHFTFDQTGSAKLVHSRYGRNRSSGIVWRRSDLAHAMSPAVTTQDNGYEYDGLQQVTRHERGYLEPSATPPPIYSGIDPATRQQREDFTFDDTGNWTQYQSTTPTTAWTQDRVNNAANQIDSLAGPGGVIQPAYDKAGNMTAMPKAGDWTTANVLTWDAWNRPVKLTEGSAETAYTYDALTRRTIKTTATETRNYYYNNQWRAIEERVSGNVKAAYVWSPIDRWTMIRRKRSVTGTLDETRYVLKDYLDPVAIIDTTATVIERYGYEAFGPVRIMDLDFDTLTTSACAWNFLFHAEFLDLDSGLYNYGFRYLHPELGRWLSRDPLEEAGGMNLYKFVGNDSTHWIDILGLFSPPKTKNAGLEKLAGLEKMLQSKCAPCCKCPLEGSQGDTEARATQRTIKCKEEATAIAAKILKEWERNFDANGLNEGSYAGGFLCFNWAGIFNQCTSRTPSLNKAWKSTIEGAQETNFEHYWASFTACGSSKSECRVEVDDGFMENTRCEMVHEGGTLPGEGWKKYTDEQTRLYWQRNNTDKCRTPVVPQG